MKILNIFQNMFVFFRQLKKGAEFGNDSVKNKIICIFF